MNSGLTDLRASVARPDIAALLTRALAEHEAHADDEFWNGFRWNDVLARPYLLNELVLDGVLRINFQTRSQTCYMLADPDAVRDALATAATPEPPPPDDAIPADLFEVIEGHEHIKNLLRLAVAAPRPVHVLLAGEPATAKTMFLGELARLYPSRYALGGTTSRAGLVEYLLRAQPRYLIVDEIDKMAAVDLSALLSVMETGLVSRLKRRDDDLRRLHVWVFAGANRIDRMPPELLSRFLRIRLDPYREQEFCAVAAAVLMRREGVDGELAWYIAHRVWDHGGRDVRDAVRLARLTTSPAEVDALIGRVLAKGGADDRR